MKMILIPRLRITIFKSSINSFHFFGILGFICGTVLGILIAQQLELNPYIILLMTGVGAATFFLLTITSKIISGEESIVYYHHEIAILIFCALILKLLHYPVLPYIDITLLGIGTFLAFGRIGCFSVGCCHGRPHKHGVKYTEAHVNAGFTWYYKDVPLLPVQLIESAYVFLILVSGIVLLFNHVQPGTFLIVYTVLYGSMRYVLEFFRGDPERPYWRGLSEAQWTTLALVGITLLLSNFNILPYYSWHLFIFLSLVATALYTSFEERRKNERRLMNPKHIQQISTVLEDITAQRHQLSITGNTTVNTYSTAIGLNISSGHYYAENQSTEHYTISGNQNLVLNKESVTKIATIISLINKYSSPPEIIKKNNGIYHLIFHEENREERPLSGSVQKIVLFQRS